jgi:phytol kinase
MKKLALFASIWLMVGFVSGTATLMGPVRGLTDLSRERGWTEEAEATLIRLVIAAFVLSSAVASAWLARIVRNTELRHVRFGIPALVLLSAVANVGLWLTPSMMGASAAEDQVGSLFTFGPYPTEQRLDRLASQGYTGVISLLHPAVVPFETKLISDGRRTVAAAGLEYLHVPMLPWVSDNTEALARIERIVTRGEGRYYVHCYLGKDRVRVVKNLVARMDPQARIEIGRELDLHEDRRTLTDGTLWERGEVVVVAEDLYLTPLPVANEYTSYIVPGTHGDVVSLLDPESDADRPWIEEERGLLETNGVGLTSLPLPLEPFDPGLALEVAETVREMPRPLIVHAMLSVGSGRAPAAEAFLQAYRTGLPPLPPSLFAEPMEGGASVRVVGPNVAVGPRPAPTQFGTYLHRRGIRECLFVGDPESEQAIADAASCAAGGLGFAAESDVERLPGIVSTGGPWYLYGPGLATAEPLVAAAVGPAIPQRTDEPVDRPAPQVIATTQAPFLERLIPGPRQVIVFGPVLGLIAALAAGFAGWLRQHRGVATPYTRKIFHFIIFTSAGVLHLTAGLDCVAMFGGVTSALVIYAVYRGAGFGFYEALARPTDAPRRTLFVLVPLATTAVGGMAANMLFGAFAYVGYLVAGWGDAIAEPVGRAWGRHRYRVPSLAGVPADRTLEGSLAVCLVGGFAAFCGLWFGGLTAGAALSVAVACGLAGAAVEAVSNHGLDNLTVQLAAAGMAFLLLA